METYVDKLQMTIKLRNRLLEIKQRFWDDDMRFTLNDHYHEDWMMEGFEKGMDVFFAGTVLYTYNDIEFEFAVRASSGFRNKYSVKLNPQAGKHNLLVYDGQAERAYKSIDGVVKAVKKYAASKSIEINAKLKERQAQLWRLQKVAETMSEELGIPLSVEGFDKIRWHSAKGTGIFENNKGLYSLHVDLKSGLGELLSLKNVNQKTMLAFIKTLEEL